MHDDDAQREARKNLNVRGSHLLEIFRTDFLYKWWNLSTVMNTSDCPTRWQSVEEEATAALPGSEGASPHEKHLREERNAL